MSRSVFGFLISGLVLAILPTAGANATAAASPDAEVSISPRATEGQYSGADGSFKVRCAPGLAIDGLWHTITQDGFTSPETAESPEPCDGAWHRQGYSTPEGFDPGRAVITVRMTLVDAATREPRGEVTEVQSVYVRPGAKIVLPSKVWLKPQGVLAFYVQGRCDVPWVLSDFQVSATQSEGTVFASTGLDIPCDGLMHTRRVLLQSVSEEFRRGWVRLDSYIHTLDSVNFDPAVSATATRMSRVR